MLLHLIFVLASDSSVQNTSSQCVVSFGWDNRTILQTLTLWWSNAIKYELRTSNGFVVSSKKYWWTMQDSLSVKKFGFCHTTFYLHKGNCWVFIKKFVLFFSVAFSYFLFCKITKMSLEQHCQQTLKWTEKYNLKFLLIIKLV